MSYKTILVHLDNSSRCATRIAFASALANEHGAHVVGLLATGLYEGSIPAGMIDTGASDYIAESAAYLKRRAEKIADMFRTQMEVSRSVSFELRQVDSLATDALVDHGRISDLVLLGQEGGDSVDQLLQAQLHAMGELTKTLVALYQDAWDRWTARFGGGVPLDG